MTIARLIKINLPLLPISVSLLLNSAAAQSPITNLPADIHSRLPTNSFTTYRDECNHCTLTNGAYITSYIQNYVPVFGDYVNITGPTVHSHGVYVNGDRSGGSVGAVFGNHLTVTTTDKDSDALRTMGRATSQTDLAYLIIGDYATLTTHGLSADGINAGYTSISQGALGSAYIDIGKYATITTHSSSAHGISASALYEDRYNTIKLGDHATIKTLGSSAYGLRTTGSTHAIIELGKNATITTEGQSAYGIYASRGSVSLKESAEITTQGRGAHGIYALSSGKIHLGDNLTVRVNNDPSNILANTHTLYASNGYITLAGGATLINKGSDNAGSYALYASGNTAHIDGQAGGKYHIEGDLRAHNSGIINLNLTDHSSIDGNTFLTSSGKINLAINGTSSYWRMTQDSSVSNLSLASSHVYFGAVGTSLAVSSPIALTLDTLSGSGIFHMRTDIVNQIGDVMNITGYASGAHLISVSDHNTGGANGTEQVTLVNMADGNASFALTSNVDIGPYIYGLYSMNTGLTSQSWYLAAVSGTPVNPVNPVNPTVTNPASGGSTAVFPEFPMLVQPVLTNAANHSISMLNTNYLLAQVELQSLLERMGNLRNTGAEGDIWSRVYAGKINSFAANIQSFDFDYSGFQLGIDKRIVQPYGELYLGAMVGYTTGKARYQVGKGDTQSYQAGLYVTYQNAHDFYVDGVLQYHHVRNQFDTRTSGGYQVSGTGSANGWRVSLELGKRFYMQGQKEGFYFEPQVQAVYAMHDRTRVRASNGLTTKLDRVNSKLGRLSLISGYNLKNGDNPVNIYFKTGIVREFDGTTGYQFNNSQHHVYKMKGQWWENGVGINATFKKTHHVYLDGYYSSGKKFDKFQLNAGYRFEF